VRRIFPERRRDRRQRHVYEDLAVDLPPVDPTDDQLAGIAEQWPLIEAEIEVLDARSAAMDTVGRLDDLLVRRLRRAKRALLAIRLTRQISRTASARHSRGAVS
jgi:hypothetical protein